MNNNTLPSNDEEANHYFEGDDQEQVSATWTEVDDYDMSDDASALASAGHGTDEDYGYFEADDGGFDEGI